MKESIFKVETMLRQVPSLKAEIDNLKMDLDTVREVMGIRGASGCEKAGSVTHAFSSTVENEVIVRDEKLEKKVQMITGLIRAKERKVKKIDNVLGTLSERERLLVELRYFKKYSVNHICEVLDIATPTFNRRKNTILKHTLIPMLLGIDS